MSWKTYNSIAVGGAVVVAMFHLIFLHCVAHQIGKLAVYKILLSSSETTSEGKPTSLVRDGMGLPTVAVRVDGAATITALQ